VRQPEAKAVGRGRGGVPFGHRGVLSVGPAASYTGRASVEWVRPMRFSGSGAQPSGACNGVQAGSPGSDGPGVGGPAVSTAAAGGTTAMTACLPTALPTTLLLPTLLPTLLTALL